MLGYFIRTLITAGGLWLADKLVAGIDIQSPGTLIIAALLLGLVNALIRPIAVLLTLPITVVTLGLFLLVINAGLFGLVAAMLDGFRVSGFLAALLGWLIVSLTSFVAAWFIGPAGRYEIILVDRRPPGR